MGIVSTNKGDFDFQTADDALKIVQKTVGDNDEFWVSSTGNPYPCLAVCINGEYAAVNFFQDDAAMWLSYNGANQDEVTFVAGGEEWNPPTDVIVSISDAYFCIREFIETNERPACIQWQKL